MSTLFRPLLLQGEDLEELLITYPDMDAMLRRVYSRRKKHFHSTSPSFSSARSPGDRDPRRRTSEPNALLPRALDPADAQRLLASGSNSPGKLPGSDLNGLRGAARLSRSVSQAASDWSEQASPMGEVAATLFSESLGFGSPPRAPQEGLGSKASSSKAWKPTARLFNNRVVPEDVFTDSGGPGAGPAAEEASDRTAPEMRTEPKKGTTEQNGTEGGGESPTGRKAGDQAGEQVKWPDGGTLRVVLNGDAQTGNGEDAQNPEAVPLKKPSLEAESREDPSIVRHRSSAEASVSESPKPSATERNESVTGSGGLSGIRSELQTLRHEVKTLRAEHRQDAAQMQEQYKAIMSVLLKVSRNAGTGHGSDTDFFVHS